MKKIIQGGLAAGLFAFIIAIAAIAQPVNAASGGLTISPTSADVTVAPGGSYKGEMLVVNQGELDISYKVYATPYSVDGEDYKPYFSPIPGATDITKWFTLGKKDGDIKVGNQNTIPFTIAVPKGTGAGSYYATVFVETEDKGSTGVVTRKRIGMIVYLRVSGNVIEKGSVAGWNVPWLQEAPFTASVKVANEGSVHYPARVKVVVSDLFGSQKFSYERNPQIIPQKIRDVPVVWENGATFGLFKVDGEVTYPGKTEQLPTKFVFIANLPMRLVTLGSIVAFVGLVVYLGRKRAVAHKK